MASLYLDIETLPGDTRPDPSEVSAPANYKDPEKIRAYQEAGVEEAYRKQSLNSMQGRILCVGVAIDDDAPTCFMLDNEISTLAALDAHICRNFMPRDQITWIGHNVAGFDLLWLWRKAVKYGLHRLVQSIKLDRYRGNFADTMTMWAGCDAYNNKCSLDALAQFLGCGRKTPGMDGSKVYEYWLAGRLEEIAAYCRDDVELVRAVYRRITMQEVA